jgi:hypothetical protein
MRSSPTVTSLSSRPESACRACTHSCNACGVQKSACASELRDRYAPPPRHDASVCVKIVERGSACRVSRCMGASGAGRRGRGHRCGEGAARTVLRIRWAQQCAHRIPTRNIDSRRSSPNSPAPSERAAIAGRSRPFSVNATLPHLLGRVLGRGSLWCLLLTRDPRPHLLDHRAGEDPRGTRWRAGSAPGRGSSGVLVSLAPTAAHQQSQHRQHSHPPPSPICPGPPAGLLRPAPPALATADDQQHQHS